MFIRPMTQMTMKAMRMARTGWLASLGALALTKQEAAALLRRLEARGETIDRQNRAALGRMLRRTEPMVDVVQEAAQIREEAVANSLNLKPRLNLGMVEHNVEQMSSQLDTALDQAHAEVEGLPLPRYDTLNATEIVDQLPDLDVDTLLAVREYEDEHSNRVTVLRAVDRRLADEIGMAEYVGLTVAEVEARLADMGESDLMKVRRFEAAHANRQGVMRATDRMLAARMPLPGYAALTADEVEAHLSDQDPATLEAIRDYELSHANRVTVLRAVEQRLNAVERELA